LDGEGEEEGEGEIWQVNGKKERMHEL